MIGEILSHFEIFDTLGEGGMGVVYKARDTKLDRVVALKLLPRRMLQSDMDRERFSLEAKSAATLNHANICTVYEYDEVDGQALIAMECIEGPSLQDRLSEGKLPLDEAVQLTIQIASGLRAAHAKGIVHRDIKPGNVLITEGGEAKISDFGLAKLMGGSTLTQTGVSMGTVAYMAPEQARGEEIGPPTDIWALGSVFYQMLMGKVPFAHDYPTAILYAIAHEEPQQMDRLESEYGAELATLIRRCLSKEPSERPTAQDVVELLGGGNSGSRPVSPSLSGSTKVPVGRRKPLFAAAAVAAVIVLALLFFPKSTQEVPDLSRASIAILPVDFGTEEGAILSPEDSTLRLTIDGLLQSVSSTVAGGAVPKHLKSVVPFEDMIAERVTTAEEAASQLGADFAIVSRISGYNPVPTIEFALVNDGAERVGEPVSVAVLTGELQKSYDGTLTEIGNLLGISEGLKRPLAGISSSSPEAFQLHARAVGLLQQRSNIRSIRAAQDQLEQAIEIDPNFAAALASLGKTLLYRYEVTKDSELLDHAERYCDQAIQIEPGLTDAYVTLGAVLAYTGKPGQARRALETALKAEPFNTRALLALAGVHEDMNEHALAEETYTRAIAGNPNYWGGYNRLGKYYVGRSEWEKAAQQYQKVIDLVPSNSIGYRNLGAMMWYLGRIDEARQNWELSLEIEPSYSTYNNLGTMHFYERNYAEAAAAYEKALEINDKDHRVWGHLATAYYWMKTDRAKYLDTRRRAAEMAEERLRINPNDLEVKAELAASYGELGEDEKSRKMLQEFGTEPDSEITSHIAFQIGAGWEELDERSRALAWIEDALRKGYPLNEITEYPGLDGLRSDPAFIRIMDSLQSDTTHQE